MASDSLWSGRLISSFCFFKPVSHFLSGLNYVFPQSGLAHQSIVHIITCLGDHSTSCLRVVRSELSVLMVGALENTWKQALVSVMSRVRPKHLPISRKCPHQIHKFSLTSVSLVTGQRPKRPSVIFLHSACTQRMHTWTSFPKLRPIECHKKTENCSLKVETFVEMSRWGLILALVST